MSPDKSLQNLFNAALEREDPAERARFLDEACGADAALRERVENLLRAADEVGGFMAQPSQKPAALDSGQSSRAGIPPTEKPGDKIGRYKLLQQIGEGGCGVVYMAEQEEPVRRRVALKVIKLGMDTKQVIARFEAERQALALMDHPNIAKVLDAGATETGRPYFVMELVRGIRITDFCDKNQLPTEELLKLFIQVCQAIQHAHQKGIIHRDVKPSNILVTMVDGLPVPKVIDFGIAKATNNQPLTDRTVFTAFEQFIGTPAYMSPEQAEMSGVDIDTRTDIYSLGVLLYELLTGGPPFDQKKLLAAGLDGMRRIIRETEPAKPSTRLTQELVAADMRRRTSGAPNQSASSPRRLQEVKGDLDWIAMKCLEKDRARRYETANGLAMDIERHLNCEPVIARPPSRLYEFQRTVRRHKFGFAAAGAVIMALAIGLGISTWQFAQKNRAYHRVSEAEREQSRLREVAEAKEKQSQQVAEFLKDMLKGVGPSVALGRDTVMLREILDKTADRLGKGLTNQAAVEAEMRFTIGDVYYAIGEYRKAETMHREALALRTNLWNEDRLELAQSLSGLALAVWKRGDLAEAEALQRRSLELRKQIRGNEHADVARCLYELAEILRYGGKMKEAAAMHLDSLAMRRRLYGNEHLEVADSLNRLGSLYSAARNDEDESLLRESLSIRTKLLGNEHPDVAEALDNVAHAVHRRNRFDEAEPMHREALAMRRKFFGRQHAEVALSLLNLGHVLKMQGRLVECEATYREALDMQGTLRGYDARMRAFIELLDLLRTQGRMAEAEALCRKELATAREQSGNVPHDVQSSLKVLARVLEQRGEFAEAEAVWREDLAMEKKLSGEEHELVANALERLAGAQFAQNKLSEANEAYSQTLAMRQRLALKAAESSNVEVLDAAAWFLASCDVDAFRDGRRAVELAEKAVRATEREDPYVLDTLAGAYAEIGQFDKAVSVEREALALPAATWHKAEWSSRLKLYLAGQPYRNYKYKLDFANSLATLVLSLIGQEKVAEAEKPARACLALREQLAPDDWRTFNSQSMLGGSLLGQKKYAEAEPFLLSGYEGMKQRETSIPSLGKVRIAESLQRLAQLYAAMGQPEKAAEWNKKLAEFDQAAAKK